MGAQLFTDISDPALTAGIANGQVGVLPSDTVYGLVCSASDQAAVARLYDLKHREHKPGTVVAANVQQLIDLGIPPRYLKAVEAYWPNPLSVIVSCGVGLQYLHQGKGTLAVRVPADPRFCSLLVRTGPLMTTSANDPGEPVAANIAQARTYFGDTIDFYVDGGTVRDHTPSTIIRVVDDAIEVVRQGAVVIDDFGRIQA